MFLYERDGFKSYCLKITFFEKKVVPKRRTTVTNTLYTVDFMQVPNSAIQPFSIKSQECKIVNAEFLS